jgi:hypothetical protein
MKTALIFTLIISVYLFIMTWLAYIYLNKPVMEGEAEADNDNHLLPS